MKQQFIQEAKEIALVYYFQARQIFYANWFSNFTERVFGEWEHSLPEQKFHEYS